jgi:hypothetical protein
LQNGHTYCFNKHRSNKTKYLLGLIREMSKNEKNITVDPEPKFNKETLKAIADVEAGKVYKAVNAADLFNKLGK